MFVTPVLLVTLLVLRWHLKLLQCVNIDGGIIGRANVRLSVELKLQNSAMS